MVEYPAIHREVWLERTSVVVVVPSFDFGLRRDTARPVVDTDLSSASAEMEEDVMDINWPV